MILPVLKINNGYFIYFAAFSAGILMFVIGIGFGWSSPAVVILQDADKTPLERPATSFETSWITSLYSLGAVVSALPAEFCADKIGTKPALLIFSLGALSSHVIMIFAKRVFEFYVARFLMGLTLGATFANLSVFIVEIAEKHNRAILGFMTGAMMFLGIISMFVIGPHLSIRYISVFALLPSVLFLILFGVYVPDTPFYFIMSNKKENAEDSLKKLRGCNDVKNELEEIIVVVEINKQFKDNRWKNLFFDKFNFKCLSYVVILNTLGQWTGTTPMTGYLQTIFEHTGSAVSSDVSAIIVSIFQFVACLVMFAVVEKIKRKTLILTSLAAMTSSLVVLITFVYLKKADYDLSAANWVPLFAIVLYACTFSAGLGIVINILSGELLAPQVKMLGANLGALFNLFWGFITALIFPTTVDAIGIAQVFLIFAIAAVLQALFVWRFIPETRGKSFLEIQNILRNKNS